MKERKAERSEGAGAELVFRQGRLYLHHTRGDKLLRFIVHDELSDVLLVKEVATKWDMVEKVAIAIPRSKALKLHSIGKLEACYECVRPHFLSLGDEQLKEQSGKKDDAAAAWLNSRDDAYELIRELVDVSEDVESRAQALNLRLVLTFSPETHAKVVAEHAALKGVKPIVIKRLLHKYVWFGMDKNALLNRDPFKGKVNSFTKKYSTKTGRPNSAVEAGYGEKHKGRNVTALDVRIFRRVLEVYYVCKDYNLRYTYEQMKHEYYRGNQHGFFPIRDSRIPTYEQFEYHARRLITLLSLEAEKAGDKDGKEMQERRGRDTDIAGAVGEVYDIDATPFNKELVSRWKIDGKTVNLGKATTLVIFDRNSKKAIGWHVYIGAENWKDGYRLCLFCALASKARHLERLGIEDPTAFPEGENIVPSFVYVDGGPGASNSGTQAVSRLRIDFKIAPPDAPYWKPTVEGGLGHSQADQANDAGGYDRKNNSRSKGKKRTAKLFAAETAFDLEKKLVEHLIAYNRRLDKKHLLTDRMKMEGVLPSSQAIFTWGVMNMGGVENRRLQEADLYMSLLEHKKNVEVTVNGASLLGSRYQSVRLRAIRLRVGSNFLITLMYHPLRMREAYWVTPDGALDELERDWHDNLRDGDASANDIEKWYLHLNALSIVNRNKTPNRAGRLSRRQLEHLLEVAGRPHKQQRKKPTNNESLVRKLEQAVEANQRRFDRPEVHLSAKQASKDRASSSSISGSQPRPSSTPMLSQASTPTATTAPRQPGPSGPPGSEARASGIPSIPATGRMNTAELFARRRQASNKKVQDKGSE